MNQGSSVDAMLRVAPQGGVLIFSFRNRSVLETRQEKCGSVITPTTAKWPRPPHFGPTHLDTE